MHSVVLLHTYYHFILVDVGDAGCQTTEIQRDKIFSLCTLWGSLDLLFKSWPFRTFNERERERERERDGVALSNDSFGQAFESQSISIPPPRAQPRMNIRVCWWQNFPTSIVLFLIILFCLLEVLIVNSFDAVNYCLLHIIWLVHSIQLAKKA